MKKNTKKKKSMKEDSVVVGIDIGDRTSYGCVLNSSGEVTEQFRLATRKETFIECFSKREGATVVIEVGTHSPWISRLLQQQGHRVVVANANRVKAIYRALNKSDKRDAEFLARLGRADEKLLAPIEHKGEQVQAHRAILGARNNLVECRTKLINCVRGTVKAFGEQLPGCSAASFPGKAGSLIPVSLKAALMPIIKMIDDLTKRIKAYDKQIAKLAQKQYPETELLEQVPGVGPLTSLAFVLTIEDPYRFRKSRDVGPYVGLTPRLHSSGNSEPQLRITRAGDVYLRKLLVQAAHYQLGRFGPESDLRFHGKRIAERGGKNAKKRAVVAVARKLSVLLHRLWVDGAEYQPLFKQQQAA
jgi:transposase